MKAERMLDVISHLVYFFFYLVSITTLGLVNADTKVALIMRGFLVCIILFVDVFSVLMHCVP